MKRAFTLLSVMALAALCLGAMAYYGAEPRLVVAAALSDVGQSVGAEEELMEAVRRNPWDAEAWKNLGVAFENTKQISPALTAYRKVFELRPESDDARMDIARTLFRLDQVDEADSLVAALLARSPFHPPALRLSGWIAMKRASGGALDIRGFQPDRMLLTAADTHFVTALRIDSTDVESLLGRALAARWLGEDVRALELLDDATLLDSSSYWTWQMKGEILAALGRATDAEGAFQTADAYAHGRPYSLEALANLARVRGDFARAAELSGRVGADGAYAEGIALMTAGDFRGAERAFLSALARNPEDEIALFQLEEVRVRIYPADDPLRTQLAQRRLDKAREAQGVWNMLLAYRNFQRSIRLAPQNSSARLQLARFFEKIGFYSAAVKELQRVEELTRSQKERLDASDILELIIRRGLSEMEEVHNVDFAELWDEPTSVLAEIIGDPGTVEEKIRWGVTPVPVPQLRIAVFPFEEAATPAHVDIGKHAARNLSTYLRLLPGVELVPEEKIEELVRTSGTRGGGLVDAGRLASKVDANLIIAGRIFEQPEEVSIEYYLVGAPDGPLLLNERITNRGASGLNKNILEIARNVSANMPLEGHIVRRDDRRFTVNLGRIHGVEEGDTLTIFRRTRDFVLPGFDWSGKKREIVATGRVIRMTERYSEVEPVTGGKKIRAGDIAERALVPRESIEMLAAGR